MKVWYKRHSIMFFLIIFSFLAVAVAADFLLHKRIISVQQTFLDTISERSTALISYREVNVRGIGLSIDELVFSDITDPKRELIRIGNIGVKFSLSDIFTRKKNVSVEQLTISSLRSTLDMEHDRYFIHTLLDVLQSENSSDAVTHLQLENINIAVRFANAALELRHLDIDAEIGSDILKATGNSSVVVEYQGERLLSNLRFATDSNFQNKLNTAKLTLFDIRYNNIFLVAQQYFLAFSEDALELYSNDSSGANVNFSFNRHTANWRGDIVLDNFVPKTLLLVSNSTWYVDSFLDSSVQGSIQISSSESELSHSINLVCENFSLPNVGNANIELISSSLEDVFDIERASISVAEGDMLASFSGQINTRDLLPTGIVRVKNLPIGNMPFSTTTEIKQVKDGISMSGRNTTLGELSIPVVYAEFSSLKNDTIAGLARLSLNSHAREQVQINFTMHTGDGNANLGIKFNNLPITPFTYLLQSNQTSSLSSLSGMTLLSDTISIKYSTDFFLVNAPTLYLLRDNTVLANLNVFVSNNNMRINAHSNVYSWLDFALQDMKIHWQSDEITLNSIVKVNQRSYNLRADYLARGDLLVQVYSNNQEVLNLQLFSEDDGNTILSVEAENLPVNDIFVSFRLDGGIFREKFNSNLYYFRVDNNRQAKILSLDGTFSGRTASFNNISYRYRDLEFAGIASMDLDNENIILATIQAPNSDELYDISLYKEESLSLAITAYKVPGNRIGLPKQASIRMYALIENVLADPEFSLSFDVEYEQSTNAIKIGALMNANTNTIAITKLSITYNTYEFLISRLALNLDSKTIDGTMFIIENKVRNKEITVQGNIDDITPLRSIFDITNLKNSVFTMLLSIKNQAGQEDIYTITRDLSFFRVLSAEHEKLLIVLRNDNQFRASLDYDDVQINANGNLGDDFFLQIAINKLDLGVFTPISIDDVFFIDNGIIKGNLTLSGTLNAPMINGNFAITQGYATTIFSTVQLGPATLNFTVENNVFYMLESMVPAANGAGTVAMEIYFEKGQVFWTLDIISNQGAGLYLYYNFGPIFADGYAKGHIKIVHKQKDVTKLTGDIRTVNATFSLVDERDLLEPTKEIAGLQVDLNITSGTGVRFLWPWSKTPLVKANVRPNDTLHVFVDPIGKENYIEGTPVFLAGDIFYFSRNFYIKSGFLNFNKNVFTLAPRITILAEMRMQTVDGPLNIYLEAIDQEFETFVPNIYSIPALPQNELVGMLGQNLVPKNSDDTAESLSNFLIYSTDIFTQFNIFNSMEDTIKNSLNLDFFSLRTPIIQNILSAVISNTLNQETVQAPLYNYFANTALVLGKYINENILAEFNMLVSEPNKDIYSGTPLEFQSQLKMDIATPIVNLEWMFNPQNFWDPSLMDTSIGVYWSFQD